LNNGFRSNIDGSWAVGAFEPERIGRLDVPVERGPRIVPSDETGQVHPKVVGVLDQRSNLLPTLLSAAQPRVELSFCPGRA
jgi:hypothetical protein